MANLNASATGPSNIDDLYTTTLNKVSKKISDNKFNDEVTLNWMKRKGNIEIVDGGDTLVERLQYDKNSTRGFFGDYEPLNTNPNQTLTEAFFFPKQAAVSISISAMDEAKNNGVPKISSLIEHRAKNAMRSLEELMNTALFNANPATNEPWSLPEIIDSSDPSRANLGGIDRDSYSWWSAQESTTTSFSASGIADMNTMKTLCASSSGKNEPDFIVTTSTVYNYYQNQLEPQRRYSDSETGEAGFRNLKHGMATIVYDKQCSSGIMYFLNSEFIKMKVYSKYNFANLPFVKPYNQAARTAQIVVIYENCTNNPRRLGKITVSAA